MNYEYGRLVNGTTGQNLSIRSKACSSATLSDTNPPCTGLGSKAWLLADRQASNRHVQREVGGEGVSISLWPLERVISLWPLERVISLWPLERVILIGLFPINIYVLSLKVRCHKREIRDKVGDLSVM